MAETPLERVDALLLREDHAHRGEATGGDAMAPRGRDAGPPDFPSPSGARSRQRATHRSILLYPMTSGPSPALRNIATGDSPRR